MGSHPQREDFLALCTWDNYTLVEEVDITSAKPLQNTDAMAQLPTVLTLLQELSYCLVYSQLSRLDYVNYSHGFLDLEDHFA